MGTEGIAVTLEELSDCKIALSKYYDGFFDQQKNVMLKEYRERYSSIAAFVSVSF